MCIRDSRYADGRCQLRADDCRRLDVHRSAGHRARHVQHVAECRPVSYTHLICHLDSKSTMQIDITINKGRGYVPADENREYCTDVNVIPIDVYKRQVFPLE